MSENGKYRFRLPQQLIDKLIMVFENIDKNCSIRISMNSRRKFSIF